MEPVTSVTSDRRREGRGHQFGYVLLATSVLAVCAHQSLTPPG
ncbi:hypothetical protein RRG08_013343 [Elysia crispata]|uniref:Uncharacterized protein n=1 Tax=Elysia crispata TaxID=231223 RepID=A0AAE1AY28_9GAST|nr:hypothetical protein RRG08_013343 [Elysia crispata]